MQLAGNVILLKSLNDNVLHFNAEIHTTATFASGVLSQLLAAECGQARQAAAAAEVSLRAEDADGKIWIGEELGEWMLVSML